MMTREQFFKLSPEQRKSLVAQNRQRKAERMAMEKESSGENNNPLVNMILGAGYEAGRIPTGILNAIGMKTRNPLQEDADKNESLGFTLGRFGGGVLAAAPVAMAASMAAPAIPFIGGALSAAAKAQGAIPSALKAGLGAAAYEGTADYEDRLGGALKGGLLGTGAGLGSGALGGGLKFVGKGKKLIENRRELKYLESLLKENIPEVKTNEIIGKLTGGRGFEEMTKDFLPKLGGVYKNAVGESRKRYGEIFKEIGDDIIPIKDFEQLIQKNKKYLPLKSREIIGDYISNPTFKKAHRVQSQIGSDLNRIRKNPSDMAGQDAMHVLEKIQNETSKNMFDYVNGTNKKHLIDLYREASSNYKQNVAPFRNDRDLFDIARRKVTNIEPTKIHSIFRNPEEGIKNIGGKIGDQGLEEMLYLSKLGRTGGEELTPKSLLQKYKSLDEIGLQGYVPNRLKNQMTDLERSISTRSNQESIYKKIMEENNNLNPELLKQLLWTLGLGSGAYGARDYVRPFIGL